MESAENRLVLVGTVCKAPEVRYSPAGIPLARFTLEHRSCQVEAGMKREALCRIVVVVAGEVLKRRMQDLNVGTPVRVEGFITRADNRSGSAQLILHADVVATEAQSGD